MNLGFNFNKSSYLTVVIDDFDVKSHNWYKDNKTTVSKSKLEIMPFHYELNQIINEPFHILEDFHLAEILFLHLSQNMVLYSGVHSSVNPNSHDQIVFTKFYSNVYYPPPYERRAWHYKYANAAQIKNTLASSNREQARSNSSIDKRISVLNETIINVMSNYIPNETKVFDDQNPPWNNAETEKLITAKSEVFKKHLKNSRNCCYTYKCKALRN